VLGEVSPLMVVTLAILDLGQLPQFELLVAVSRVVFVVPAVLSLLHVDLVEMYATDRDGSFKISGTVFSCGRKYAPIKALGQGAYGIVMYVRYSGEISQI
jgi:hypothetical protein